ncbi:MAG: hypothetical protein QF473_32420, partial [Planctomycetota bacterium]|nr:hypothetical protein [Planctomycetota bacterium]
TAPPTHLPPPNKPPPVKGPSNTHAWVFEALLTSCDFCAVGIGCARALATQGGAALALGYDVQRFQRKEMKNALVPTLVQPIRQCKLTQSNAIQMSPLSPSNRPSSDLPVRANPPQSPHFVLDWATPPNTIPIGPGIWVK